jgi:3-oxoadipate enol-lactonase
MPFAATGALNIHYQIAGTGNRLLYISGTGADLRTRPGIFDGELPKRFQLLAYDQRGLGQTEKPHGPYSMSVYADDTARLMDCLGWEDAMVFGVSFGGMVAQEFTLRHPQKVTRLVLACTSAGGAGGASYPLHELMDMDAEERFLRMLPISDTRHDKAWQNSHPDTMKALLEFSKAQRELLEGPEKEASLRGAQLQLLARKDHDTWDRLHQIQVPVFICGGKYDALATPGNLENLHSRIKGSTLKLYQGGHMFLLQDANANQDIIRFLQA